MTEPTRERTWAEPWDRGRLGGLNNALNVVRSLNGNGHDEPSDPALDAAATAIERLVREAHAAILDAYPDGHKPGDFHRYITECTICGQPGTIRLSLEPQVADSLPAEHG